ncbi:radical SAM protein [Micromonospora sp. NPDC049282]|uniref:radical SAM protein n=1 Tax=Micromonospora sp. NPDC049282 TaxID=3364269 RepID=UPI0037127D8E
MTSSFSATLDNCTADAACRVGDRMGVPSIWLELVEDCNLNCVFCYNPWRPQHSSLRTQATISAAMLRTVISTITAKFGPAQVTLSGGEPLMYPGLSELTGHLSALGHQIGMTSNGRSATRRRIAELKHRGLSHMSIPVHSAHGRVHNELAGAPSWSGAIRALSLGLELGISVTMSCVLTRRNIAGVGGVAEIAAQLGIKRFVLNSFHVTGQGLARADLSITADEFEDAKHMARAALPVSTDLVVGAPPDSKRGTRTAIDRLVVSPYGDIKLCAQSTRGVVNVLSDGMEQLEKLLDGISNGSGQVYIDRVDNCSCFSPSSP